MPLINEKKDTFNFVSSYASLLQLMILVDDAGSFFPAINHSPWDGVTLADFVMPFFLFIVGVALGLAYKVIYSDSSATLDIFRDICTV